MGAAQDHLKRSPSVGNDGAVKVWTQLFGTFVVSAEVRDQALMLVKYWLCLLKTSLLGI